MTSQDGSVYRSFVDSSTSYVYISYSIPHPAYLPKSVRTIPRRHAPCETPLYALPTTPAFEDLLPLIPPNRNFKALPSTSSTCHVLSLIPSRAFLTTFLLTAQNADLSICLYDRHAQMSMMPLETRAVTTICRACMLRMSVVVVATSIIVGAKMGCSSGLRLVDGRIPEHVALLPSKHQWISIVRVLRF